jgi:hypothetical protein
VHHPVRGTYRVGEQQIAENIPPAQILLAAAAQFGNPAVSVDDDAIAGEHERIGCGVDEFARALRGLPGSSAFMDRSNEARAQHQHGDADDDQRQGGIADLQSRHDDSLLRDDGDGSHCGRMHADDAGHEDAGCRQQPLDAIAFVKYKHGGRG